MIVFSQETFTPAEARRILAEHDEAVASGEIINRKRKPPTVRRYAADLLAGRWYPETGETIKFETLDQRLVGRHLVDGQNRLASCVLADRDLVVYVARGVGRRAYSYIDGGAIRNLAVKLHIGGNSHAPQLAAALKWLCRWDEAEGRLTGVAVTDQGSLDLLESDPAVRKSVAKAQAVAEQKLLGVGVAAFLHRIFCKHDLDLADQFIDALSAGAGLNVGDPFLLLRQKLTANKSAAQRKKFQQLDVIAMSVRAWNAKRGGREIKLLRGASNLSEMPTLDFGQGDDKRMPDSLVDGSAEGRV